MMTSRLQSAVPGGEVTESTHHQTQRSVAGQPGSPVWQGPARPRVSAGEHSPGAGRGTGEPNRSSKHTWVPTGKRFVSSLCRASSYCAKTAAPCTRGAESLEQEAETQHPRHGSPCSARAPLLKLWVGAEPPNPRKPVGISLRQRQSAALRKAQTGCNQDRLVQQRVHDPPPPAEMQHPRPTQGGRDGVWQPWEGWDSPSRSRAAPLPRKETEVTFPPENQAYSAHLPCFISLGKRAASTERRGEAHGHESPTALSLPLASQLSWPSQPVGKGCQALFSPAKLKPDPRPAQSFWLLIMWMQFSCF